MAQIVLGIGTSHGPQLNIPPEQWHLLLDKDQKDPRFNYGEVLQRANPNIQKELGEEVFKKKYEACQAAIAALRKTFSRFSPDAVVVIGDDQHEQFWEDNMPMFSIYWGETVQQRGRRPERSQNWRNADAAYKREGERTFGCESQLAKHVIKELIARGFDLATSNKLRAEVGIGHAFTFVLNRILPNGGVPIVPLMVNAFFPPNQPLPFRCYELGKALGEAIRSWSPARKVAVVASGGLSHFIIDEDLDRMVIDGLIQRDKKKLSNLPSERLLCLGTGEALNWIVAAGAVEHLKPKLLDYVPCYRTPAGTGCAMAFMEWT